MMILQNQSKTFLALKALQSTISLSQRFDANDNRQLLCLLINYSKEPRDTLKKSPPTDRDESYLRIQPKSQYYTVGEGWLCKGDKAPSVRSETSRHYRAAKGLTMTTNNTNTGNNKNGQHLQILQCFQEKDWSYKIGEQIHTWTKMTLKC